MKALALSEVVRPRGNRDEAGRQGELLHQLADWLEKEVDTVLREDITLQKDITVGELLKLLEQVAKAAAGRFPAARFAPVFAQLQARNPEECYDSVRV